VESIEQLRNSDVLQLLSTLPLRMFWLWSTANCSPWQTGPFHRLVQVFHVLLMGLALCGTFLNWRHILVQWPLWIYALYQTLLHVVFHVEARFTLEARLGLCLYAGAAVVSLWANAGNLWHDWQRPREQTRFSQPSLPT
jgi:hypothetical protein